MDEINPTRNYLSFTKLFEMCTMHFCTFFNDIKKNGGFWFKKSIGKQNMSIHHKNFFKMIASLVSFGHFIVCYTSAVIVQDEL